MEEIMDKNDYIYEDCLPYSKAIDTDETEHQALSFLATPKGTIEIFTDKGEPKREKVYDVTHPFPSLDRAGTTFLVESLDGVTSQKARMIRKHEIINAVGFTDRKETRMWERDEEWRYTSQRLITTTPEQTWTQIASTLFTCEQRAKEKRAGELEAYGPAAFIISKAIDKTTTIPEPTTEAWVRATGNDHDLRLLATALENGTKLSKADLNDKRYYKEWIEERLELETGVIYQYEEPKLKRIRQLKRRVVPRSLRHVIIAAYHSTPLAGHVGIYKTYWRIATRFFWPGMSQEIRNLVRECAYCQIANATSHKDQHIFTGIPVDEPFDIICIDVWHPGKTVLDSKSFKQNTYQKATLVSLCTLTGFVSTAFINEIDSTLAARLAFSHFFIPNGLPKVVLVDAGSEFKGVLTSMCEILKVKYIVVPPEMHDAILAERFHRYMNKVQVITQAETQSYEQWKMGTLFATYAWNASPVDGLDVIRSFAAKARTFRFPLDATIEGEVTRIPQQGEDTLEHIETMFPLWFKQKEMFRILQDERRQHHRDLMNDKRKVRTFQPGDIVIVRRQVQSKDGKPAKLTMRPRGPYRVIKKANTNAYEIQKIPSVRGLRRKPGKPRVETAARMTKLPSSLVIHKRVNTMDTQFADAMAELVDRPLEYNIGLFDFGKFRQAPTGEDYAWVKINEMWNEELDPEDTDDEESDQEDDAVQRETVDQRTTSTSKTRQRERKQQRYMKTRSMTKRATQTTQEVNRERKQGSNVTDEKTYLKKLYQECEESTDKLFIVRTSERRSFQLYGGY